MEKENNATLLKALLELNSEQEKKEEKRTLKNSKLTLGINKNYIIFSDGRIYSLYFGGKFLEPYPYVNRCKTATHYGVSISYRSKSKKFFISRLVYFYFGNHNYTSIFEMPYITYKDGNSENVCIDNLKEALPGETTEKARKVIKQMRAAAFPKKVKINECV